MAPTIEFETQRYAAGYRAVAGIDEAGRGCWAGPVVAAAVVLSPAVLAQPEMLAGLDDSKKLTASQREMFFQQIDDVADGVGVGIVPAFVIDAWNIVQATRTAMVAALLALPLAPDALLIDALSLDLTLPQDVLIKGDSRSLSIAAASVVAKVTRDHLMDTAERAYAGYGFGRHKGYGTAAHRNALRLLGTCPMHRMSYRPVAEIHDTERA